jgi:DNA repair exonuclease SbcCD ATPase subunit
MRKRKTHHQFDVDEAAQEACALIVAEDIRSSHVGTLAFTDPEVLKQNELERRNREQVRAAERAMAELEELAEQAEQERSQRVEQAERERLRRAEQAQQRETQRRAAAERQQLTALHQEWSQFKAAAVRAQIAQRRESHFNEIQQMAAELLRTVTAPPEPEPQIVYVEREEDRRWGQLPTLPTWR